MNGPNGRIEIYMKLSCQTATLSWVEHRNWYPPAALTNWGLQRLAVLDAMEAAMEHCPRRVLGYSGDCRPWLFHVQSVVSEASGGRVAD
jgi:hypothetical protein